MRLDAHSKAAIWEEADECINGIFLLDTSTKHELL